MTAHQASLSITISWSLLKRMSIEPVMPSNHLILCNPLLLPSSFPSIRVLSNESALPIRWPEYWRFSFSISPSNEYSKGEISYSVGARHFVACYLWRRWGRREKWRDLEAPSSPYTPGNQEAGKPSLPCSPPSAEGGNMPHILQETHTRTHVDISLESTWKSQIPGCKGGLREWSAQCFPIGMECGPHMAFYIS